MNALRGVLSVAVSALVLSLVGTWLSAESLAQTPAPTASTGAAKAATFNGAWTLNKDLSDHTQNDVAAGTDNPQGGGGRRGGGGGRGGFGGRRGGGFGNPGANVNADPQETARVREAMRDVMNPPDHLTIVSTDTMIAMTGPDGRTIRLSPDGKKIKDENTKIERKTRWDADKLVSDINGLGPGKITETYTIDADHHQLHIAAEIEGTRGGQARTISHVYDQDAR